MAHDARVSLDIAHEILTTRVIDAPRERVWRAFVDPAQMVQWWGPVGFSTTVIEMDVRVGSVCRHTMVGPDGRVYPNRMRYTEVREPERLAWAHDADSDGPPLFHVTVSFQDLGGRTLLTLRHVFADGATRDQVIARANAVQGAIETTMRLSAHVALMPEAQDHLVVRDFDAPREHVWQAWTEARHLARWFGPASFRVTRCESDARVGGRYAITMTGPYPGPGDTDYPFEGEYLERVQPERLVMTQDCAAHPAWWHDAVRPGRAADDRNPAGIMLQTVTLQALSDTRTRLVVRTRMVSAEVLESMRKMGMDAGWAETLDRLGAELAAMGGA